DGQGRLRHVLLEGRAPAIYRRVVEVRPEFAHRVLRVRAHEDLPTESDDRVVRRTVAVVLEAPAIEGDHPADVVRRPEDVVVEEAVTVVGGLLGDLRRSDGTVPHERRDPVER